MNCMENKSNVMNVLVENGMNIMVDKGRML